MGRAADTIADLDAFTGRLACSDAERRAALHLHDALRSDGDEAWVETVWVRPSWAGSLFWHALLGVAGALVGTAVPAAGLAVGAAVLLSFAAGLTGGPALLDRLLLVRRATQVVLVEPDRADADVTVWLHAATDAPRTGPGARLLRSRLRPRIWMSMALAVLVGTGVVRVLDPGAVDLEWLQFVAAAVLLVVAAAAIDVVLADPGDGRAEAAAVTAALLALRRLRDDPAPGLAAGLLLGGAASEAAPLALRAWLRSARPEPSRTLLVDIGPVAGDLTVWRTRRPQLRAAFEAAADGGDGPASAVRGRAHRAAPGLRRLPLVAVHAPGVAPADPERRAVQADAVAEVVAGGLRALELQPLRSRANAANQS